MLTAPPTIDKLWQRYAKRRTVKSRNALVEHYLHIAHSIARQYAERAPRNVLVEELESDAVLGLIDAVEKFDHTRGFRFSTYASARVRGALLDAIRNRDDCSRYARKQTRRYIQVEHLLLAETGTNPTEEAVRERLEISEREFALVVRNQARSTFSIKARYFDKDGSEHSLDPVDPTDRLGLVIRRDEVENLLQHLPPKLRRLMRLRYVRGESTDRIARRYRVGPSRISQQHGVAMALLRAVVTRPHLEVA